MAGLIDPNAAPESALRAVPGLTPALAQELVGQRPFADMAAFDAWIGTHLDETAREALYRIVFIPLDLNDASREDILLIPGVGPRMAHEFEEYRPYDSIERFRREIGKYVDDEEVARLERYVRISGE